MVSKVQMLVLTSFLSLFGCVPQKHPPGAEQVSIEDQTVRKIKTGFVFSCNAVCDKVSGHMLYICAGGTGVAVAVVPNGSFPNGCQKQP